MITRRGLLAGLAALPFVWQGQGKKKGKRVPNGLRDGLQAYYKMLNVSDSSGAGLNLTNNGTVTFASGGPVSGEGFATFDGSNYLYHAPIPLYQDWGTGTDWLVSFWVKTSAMSGLMVMSDRGDITTPGWACSLNNNFGSTFEAYTSLGASDFLVANSDTAAWHNLQLWRQADNNIFFSVDGAAADTVDDGAFGSGSNIPFLVGASLDDSDVASYFLVGQIASIALYKTTIPGVDGRALLAAGTPFSDFEASAVPSLVSVARSGGFRNALAKSGGKA